MDSQKEKNEYLEKLFRSLSDFYSKLLRPGVDSSYLSEVSAKDFESEDLKDTIKGYLEAISSFFNSVIASSVNLNETQSTKEEYRQYLINLIPYNYQKKCCCCYSCGLPVSLQNLPTKDDLKYLIVLQSKEAPYQCSRCQAPWFLKIQGLNKKDSSCYLNYSILPEFELQMLAKMYLVDTLVYSGSSPPSELKLFYVQSSPGRLNLVIRPLSSEQTAPALNVLYQTQYNKVLNKANKFFELLSKDRTSLKKELGEWIGFKWITPKVSDGLGITFEGIDRTRFDYRAMAFLDLDGTCTCHQLKKVHEAVSGLSSFLIKVLQILEKDRILKTVFTTGRPLEQVFFLMKDNNLIPTAITANGNGVIYPRNYNFQQDTFFQKSQHKQLLKNAVEILRQKYDLRLVEDRPFTNADTEVRINRYYAPRRQDLQRLMNSDPLVKSMLESAAVEKLVVTQGGPSVLHVTTVNCTKGSVAKRLIEYLGYDKSRTFNVGDHLNDVSMKGAVGTTMGVANAQLQYREKCDYVSKFSEAKGTLDCIKHFLLENKVLNEKQFQEVLLRAKESYLRERWQ